MQIKVKYSETYDREHTITLNEDEFLEWLNEGSDEPYATVAEFRTDAGEDSFAEHVKEYLEDGGPDEWTGRALDPFANVYDTELQGVEVL